jgi:hypothetical protein
VRKLLIGAIAGAVMLAVAAVAMATTTQTFQQKYTASKPSKSSGTAFSTSSTEDQNQANNNQPKSTREFDITFPAGSKIDYTAAPVCANLQESSNNPCPTNTKIGSGHAKVLLPFQGSAPIDAAVTAYNRKKGLFLYVVPTVGAPVVLKPAYHGLTLKTATPPTCLASTNENGHCVDGSGNPGAEAVLTEFDLKTKAVKKGKKTYLKTPPKCTKAGWKFQAKITYADGSSVSPSSIQKCSK